jgi:2-phosphosulfolactate phosphatase
MTRTVVIDCFPECLPRYRDGRALVAVDIIRASTTAVTAVSLGRRCLPAVSIDEAVALARSLPDPLLVGELGGSLPYGFHLQNSPCAVAAEQARDRPMILLSTSGTRLMAEAAGEGESYAACLRNASAQAEHLLGHERVRLLGAESRGEFREEDQLCSARIGRALLGHGFRPGDEATEALIERWSDVPDDGFLESQSVRYLRDTGQEDDVQFVLEHIDDLAAVFPLAGSEVVMRSLS